MTPKFTRGGYHRNGGTLLAPDLRRELGKVPGQVLRRNLSRVLESHGVGVEMP
jgi:hypothetical protein